MITAKHLKNEQILQLFHKNNHIADFILDGSNDWFSHKISKKEYHFNFINGTLGMFEALKVDNNSFETGDFIEQIPVETV